MTSSILAGPRAEYVRFCGMAGRWCLGAGRSIVVCGETGGQRCSSSLFWVSWADGFGKWSYISNVLVVVSTSRTLELERLYGLVYILVYQLKL